MKATCLASSSAGNCYIIDLENGSRTSTIMLECGIPAKEIIRGMTQAGKSMDEIEACLITHFHSDHSKAIHDIAKWGIPIYTHAATLAHCGEDGNAMEPLKRERIADGVYVLPFLVKHDAEGSLGFIIKTKSECILFVNDCKMWEANLSSFRPNYVFIECNYWERQVYAQLADLHKAVEDQSTPSHEKAEFRSKIKQYERNVNSHMSLSGCIRSLRKLNLSRCVAIFLMHLSDANANEYEMKSAVQTETGIATYVCKKKGGIK